jgi:hypothetical protein
MNTKTTAPAQRIIDAEVVDTMHETYIKDGFIYRRDAFGNGEDEIIGVEGGTDVTVDSGELLDWNVVNRFGGTYKGHRMVQLPTPGERGETEVLQFLFIDPAGRRFSSWGTAQLSETLLPVAPESRIFIERTGNRDMGKGRTPMWTFKVVVVNPPALNA